MGARFGQHFLRSEAVLQAILDAANLQPGERVLEIGPGKGVLTKPLCQSVGDGRVVAIEADPVMVPFLKDLDLPNLELVLGDAVKQDLESFGYFDAIVANLPYQISGPITSAFLHLLRRPDTRWKRAVLMVQKEFGDRLLAAPGTSAYGRLSVHASRRVKATRVRNVPPGCFDPPPKVDSVVVKLEPHPEAPFRVGNESMFVTAVDASFQQRRKKLRNTLPPALARHGVEHEATLSVLDRFGWGDKRPEEMDPSAFAAIVAQLA